MFELIKTEGKARRGVFTCAHGTVQTPVFMNVGILLFTIRRDDAFNVTVIDTVIDIRMLGMAASQRAVNGDRDNSSDHVYPFQQSFFARISS